MPHLKIHFECKSECLFHIYMYFFATAFYVAGVIVDSSYVDKKDFLALWTETQAVYKCAFCALIAGQQNQDLHYSLRSTVWQEKNPKSPPSRPAVSRCLSACNLHPLTPLCGGPSSPLPADVLPALLESSRTHPSASWEWQRGFKKDCLVG